MYIEDWQAEQRQTFIDNFSVGLYRVGDAATAEGQTDTPSESINDYV